jgi:hypothetical protein
MKRIDVLATVASLRALLDSKPAIITPDPPCEGFVFFSNYSHERFLVDGPAWTISTLTSHVATLAHVGIYDVLVIDHPAMHPELRFAVYLRSSK